MDSFDIIYELKFFDLIMFDCLCGPLSLLFRQLTISSVSENEPLLLENNATQLKSIFTSSNWLQQLQEQAGGEERVVDILRKYPNDFRELAQRDLKNIQETGGIDPRISYISNLFEICYKGKDIPLLTQFLELRGTQKLLPPIFSIMEKKKETSNFLWQVQKSVKLVDLQWDRKTLSVCELESTKIAKKTSKLAWSIYFLDGSFSGSKNVSVYAKGSLIGLGTFKIVYHFVPMSGDTSLALARGFRYKHKKSKGTWTKEMWVNSTNAALRKDSRVSGFLTKNNVPYILSIRTIFCGDTFWNVMELCSRGDLQKVFDQCKTMQEKIYFLKQVLLAIEGMHSHKLVHGDLKLSNIVVNNKDEVRITDFGASRELKNNPFLEIDATYPPPENVENYFNNEKTSVSCAHDMWAIGDFLYYALKKSSLLDKFSLNGSQALDEVPVLQKKRKIELDLKSDDTEVKTQAEKQNELHKKELEKINALGGFYSDRLKSLQEELKKNFGDSKDTYQQCIVRLFSIDPSLRPSAREVREIIENLI